MAKALTIAQGQPLAKNVNGEPAIVTACVAADKAGQYSSFGIGFTVERNGKKQSYLWGLFMPTLLLRSWRAMKLFEKVPNIIIHETAAWCWEAAREETPEWEYRALDSLEKQFNSYEDFLLARAQVIGSVPTLEELDAMMRIIAEKGLELDDEEKIRAEVKRGQVSIDEILPRLRERDAARAAYKNKKEAELAEYRRKQEARAQQANAARKRSLWSRLWRIA